MGPTDAWIATKFQGKIHRTPAHHPTPERRPREHRDSTPSSPPARIGRGTDRRPRCLFAAVAPERRCRGIHLAPNARRRDLRATTTHPASGLRLSVPKGRHRERDVGGPWQLPLAELPALATVCAPDLPKRRAANLHHDPATDALLGHIHTEDDCGTAYQLAQPLASSARLPARSCRGTETHGAGTPHARSASSLRS